MLDSLKSTIDAIEIPLEKIKYLEKQLPKPKITNREAYAKHYGDTKSDLRKEFDEFCEMQDEIIHHISWGFTQYEHYDENWQVKEKDLDYSLESIKVIDKLQNNSNFELQSNCKKDFVKKWLIPELYCYVLSVIIKNFPQEKYWRVYHDNILKMKIQPNCGNRALEPYKYIELCVLSGYDLFELIRTFEKMIRNCH